MSENPSRRASEWPPPNDRGGRGQQPGYDGQRRDPAWDQQRAAQRPASRDERTRRGTGGPAPAPWEAAGGRGGRRADGGYDQGGYDQAGYGQGGYDQGGYDQQQYGGYDDRSGSGPRSRGAAASAAPGRRGGYDDEYADGEAEGRGRSGRRGGAPARTEAAADGGLAVGARMANAFVLAALTSALIAFATATAAGNGPAKSIAGITLNKTLLMYTFLALPVGAGLIAGLLKWRRINPVGLTWGYGVVAGFSWLALVFMLKVKNLAEIPPLLSVPVATGAAFAGGAYLTDDSTTNTGRYALLAAVLASHIAIVVIVVTIVTAK